jgi:hypothetical protein
MAPCFLITANLSLLINMSGQLSISAPSTGHDRKPSGQRFDLRRPHYRLYLLVLALLATHAALALSSLRSNFVTIDEVGHVPAGLDHWQTANYSMYRVNPPLIRMLSVLPILAASPDTSGLQSTDDPGIRSEWKNGRWFASANAARYFDLVCLARLTSVVWSLLGGYLVFSWARTLYGDASGLLALTLWCFGPNVLAHAQLVTPDIPATVTGLAATYAFWCYLRSPSWFRAVLAGLLLGVAQLSKFTSLLFYAVWPVLWLVYQSSRWHDASTHSIPTRRQVGHGTFMVFLSLVVINAGYEFRGSFRPLGEIPFISDSFAGKRLEGSPSGNRFRSHWLGTVPVPLPADFLRGIDVQRRDFERLGPVAPSYLAGEWRATGWWYYYLYALAVKVPLGIWVLVLWGLVLTLSRHPSSAPMRDELVLWLPALAVLILVSSQTGFNHHLRYVLPMIPFVVISTGKLGYFLQARWWKTGSVVAAFTLWAAGSSLAVHPHYLSYFNELAGGPDNGNRHLLNSNIDWGQDLLFLKKWLVQHPEAKPLRLAYYNIIDPAIVGLEFTLPPFGPTARLPATRAEAQRLGPQPGYYAVSVNYLHGFSGIAPPNGKGGYTALPPQAYEYFRHFQPIAKAGYSIFIYHITLEDANRFRREWGLPLVTVETSTTENAP